MHMKRFFLLASTCLLLVAVFMLSGCAQPVTAASAADEAALFTPGEMPASLDRQDGSAASRSAVVFFTNTLWYTGSDVQIPHVHWYFNSTATAPAGYHYRLKFWYYADYYCDTCGTDGWVLLGYRSTTNLGLTGYTKDFDYTTPALWVRGLVQAWMVNNATGASSYLGYAQEIDWTWVTVISD